MVSAAAADSSALAAFCWTTRSIWVTAWLIDDSLHRPDDGPGKQHGHTHDGRQGNQGHDAREPLQAADGHEDFIRGHGPVQPGGLDRAAVDEHRAALVSLRTLQAGAAGERGKTGSPGSSARRNGLTARAVIL